MAVTKIIPIKVHLQKAVDYICNKNKVCSDENVLISSRGCSVETAIYDFERQQRRVYENKNISRAYKGNKAYHLIQSFTPGEVEADKAHEIGKEFADKVLNGKYNYIISTHVDKGHIHNHIIFCSADNEGNGRYNDNTKERYRRERISDKLCKENGLSVINKSADKRKGLKYNEWEKSKNKNNWRSTIYNDIDYCIENSKSYKEFLDLMKSKNYKIVDKTTHKYITFIATIDGKERRIRGKDFYSRENIKDRINVSKTEKKYDETQKQTSNNKENVENLFAIPPKKEKAFVNDKPYIVDLHKDKYKNSYGLNKWGHQHNLQAANELFRLANNMGYKTIKSVYQKIDIEQNKISELEKVNKTMEQKIIENRTLLKYIYDYNSFKNIHNGYNQTYDKEAYFEKYGKQILMYENAKKYLNAYGIISINDETIAEINNDIELFNKEIENNINGIKEIKDKIKDLNYIKRQWEIFENNSKIDIQQNKNSQNLDL